LILNSPARLGLQQLTIHMGHRPNARDVDQQPVLDGLVVRDEFTERLHGSAAGAINATG
jgi:hypothetical protein